MSITSPLQEINTALFNKHRIKVFIKRDDLIHPIISGNKWRKLKYNLLAAKNTDKQGIISFGGSYSNHIHALAFACHQERLNCIGIIRGEESYHTNFTLSWAKHWGMSLNFVDRKTYRMRANSDYLQALQTQYPQHLIVPEGGSNRLALPGVSEVIDELNQQVDFDTLITPVGSGGTLAGLIQGDNNQHNLLGIAVLKQQGYLSQAVKDLLPQSQQHLNNWQINDEFHRGGYAKFSKEDAQKILLFSQQSGINFEPVYSGKMLLALLDLVEQGYFSAGHRIVLLHTGGLQGLGGLAERNIISDNDWDIPNCSP